MICLHTQGFAEDVTGISQSLGLKGHPGVDIQCGYGTAIECPLDGYVYKIINDKFPASDSSGYWAAFLIAEYKGQIGELCLGHCAPIKIEIGQKVKMGEVIALEANKGLVYAGQTRITKKMQEAGDTRGHHRHWQWRPLTKTKTPRSKTPKLMRAYPFEVYRDTEGFAYEIPDYYNGYNGLSPRIKDILNDYNEVKFNQAIERNIIIEQPVAKTPLQVFLEILKSYLAILKAWPNRK